MTLRDAPKFHAWGEHCKLEPLDQSDRLRIVSSPAEQLVLVDAQDRAVGHASKDSCHQGDGMLHRAFSLLLFNDRQELLIQRRADGKPLWPGFWSNSCCSHPRLGEDMLTAVHRRAREELGLTVDVTFLYRFHYQARYGDIGSEHEICSVFHGRAHGPPRINPMEVTEWRFIGQAELSDWMRSDPDSFTPWFHLEWSRYRANFCQLSELESQR